MGLLSPEQIRAIRDYLDQQGLKDESLQTDLLDHLCCDIEMDIENGKNFEETFEKVKSQIPKNQFKKIQTETMEAINKKTSLTTILTYATFSTLVFATAFKMMHLPGTVELLIMAFAGLIITLSSVIFTNPLIKEKDRGRIPLILLIVSITMYVTSLCFQMLHLPGTTFLRVTSVISSILILSGYAIYYCMFPVKSSAHFIVQYVKNEGTNIEKVLIILFVFGSSLTLWQNDFLFIIFFMLSFSFGGIFYFIKAWRLFDGDQFSLLTKILLLLISIAGYSMFILPTIRLFGPESRIIMIWGSYLIASVAVGLYYLLKSKESLKLLLGFFSFLVSMFAGLNLIGKTVLAGMPEGHYFLSLVNNPVFFIGLLVILILFFKKEAMRGLLLMTLGMFVVAYNLPDI